MPDETYNGWTNYATWLVNVEIYGDRDWSAYGAFATVSAFADWLQDDLDTLLDDTRGNDVAVSLARAFISDVNWYELAESYATDYPEIIEPDTDECHMCDGSGECPECHGDGWIGNPEDECDDCRGSGECVKCDGIGEIEIPWSPES